jgi:hypothetical protein
MSQPAQETQHQHQPQHQPQHQQPPSDLPQVKEIRVSPNQNAKQVMYLIKEFLLQNEEYVDIVSGTAGAPVATRAAEALVRLQYVTYNKIKSDTTLVNNRRRTRLIIRLRKTQNFKKLYDENEEIRKKTQEVLKTDK